ncbi:SRPBCC family protein [Crossiella sp. CA-258035]|uniref:SRPBCC family protein n=1 Tax=Crossiella sp. CA-258035 TaxID=2981138 RepID=UPI0024BC3FE4|nr:SRPBCC family protein [Crossiella sp. CA-258035]WHT19996.1 SRPBCC family protein [Crossiella sp. CA-258035]
MISLGELTFTRRAWLPAAPHPLYDLVTDVSMIGSWSPTAVAAEYDDGAGPRPGAWFSGRNQRGGRTWRSRSQVETAEPGAEFSFVVGGLAEGIVRWRWTFTADGPGTVVAQHWQVLRLDPVLGSTREELLTLREVMAASAESTLLAMCRWVSEQAA